MKTAVLLTLLMLFGSNAAFCGSEAPGPAIMLRSKGWGPTVVTVRYYNSSSFVHNGTLFVSRGFFSDRSLLVDAMERCIDLACLDGATPKYCEILPTSGGLDLSLSSDSSIDKIKSDIMAKRYSEGAKCPG